MVNLGGGTIEHCLDVAARLIHAGLIDNVQVKLSDGYTTHMQGKDAMATLIEYAVTYLDNVAQSLNRTEKEQH
jgi:hypothetical protein